MATLFVFAQIATNLSLCQPHRRSVLLQLQSTITISFVIKMVN